MIDADLSTDAQMLWKSLRRQPDGMSSVDLANLWMPTWSVKQVQALLDHLVELGLVRAIQQSRQTLYQAACLPVMPAAVSVHSFAFPSTTPLGGIS